MTDFCGYHESKITEFYRYSDSLGDAAPPRHEIVGGIRDGSWYDPLLHGLHYAIVWDAPAGLFKEYTGEERGQVFFWRAGKYEFTPLDSKGRLAAQKK